MTSLIVIVVPAWTLAVRASTTFAEKFLFLTRNLFHQYFFNQDDVCSSPYNATLALESIFSHCSPLSNGMVFSISFVTASHPSSLAGCVVVQPAKSNAEQKQQTDLNQLGSFHTFLLFKVCSGFINYSAQPLPDMVRGGFLFVHLPEHSLRFYSLI